MVEIADQPEGEVPAYMPNEHPFKNEFGEQNYLPEAAVRGGAETMYPEFRAKLRTLPPPPPKQPPARPAARAN